MTESVEGRPLAAGLELLAWARDAAGTVEAVHWGPGAAGVATAVGRHGAARVLSTGDLGDRLPGAAVAAAMAAAVSAGAGPDAVLFATTHDQRDIAGRLSVRLDRPLLTNAVGLSVGDDGSLVTRHELFGGATVVTARFTAARPHLVMVRPKSWVAAEVTGGGPPAEVVALAVPDTGRAATAARVRRRSPVQSAVSLDDAQVVVAGGRGLGPGDRFALVGELARLLGGAVAASRPAVDAGWAPFSAQVGLSGTTVAPEVYLAFGISGASQHLAGMSGARTVVAVNTDPGAPIMALADLAVVGDAASVLSRLLIALSRK
ncbi:MAG: electron transfer flavoprotein subunit alpha/FixB family protein [Acidimicrobiales bacterium]